MPAHRIFPPCAPGNGREKLPLVPLHHQVKWPIKQSRSGYARLRAWVDSGEQGVPNHQLGALRKPSLPPLLHPWELPGRASELPGALTVRHRGAEVSQD